MREHYVPGKMVITAIGNVEHSALLELATSYFGHLNPAPPDAPTRNLFNISAYAPFKTTLKKNVCQAQLLLGTVIPRNDRHYWGLLVLNTMLSSGMSSILNLELREKRGLVYQAYSSIAFLDDVTTFNIYAGTDKGKIAKTLDTIAALFAGKTLSEPDPAEIEAAKSKMRGSLIMGMEKMTQRMSNLAQDLFYFDRLFTPAEKAELIESVCAEDVAAATSSLEVPSLLSTLIYKPSK
jgi:predicted Zn-dependent peptidase